MKLIMNPFEEDYIKHIPEVFKTKNYLLTFPVTLALKAFSKQ